MEPDQLQDQQDAAPQDEAAPAKKPRVKHKYVAVLGEQVTADTAQELRKALADRNLDPEKFFIMKGRLLKPRIKQSVGW